MTTVIPPIVKEVVVAAEPAGAFAAFTDGVKSWWPVATHSVAGDEGRDLVLDETGFVETLADGSPCSWGSVLAWEPPHRLAMTWHPGQDPDPHTLVEVTFEAADGGTLVRLVHSGWENLGLPADAGAERLGGYDEGWDVVLGSYVSGLGAVGMVGTA
jgi:uncharacterized protein YndB with AHSA1/START domain